MPHYAVYLAFSSRIIYSTLLLKMPLFCHIIPVAQAIDNVQAAGRTLHTLQHNSSRSVRNCHDQIHITFYQINGEGKNTYCTWYIHKTTSVTCASRLGVERSASDISMDILLRHRFVLKSSICRKRGPIYTGKRRGTKEEPKLRTINQM